MYARSAEADLRFERTFELLKACVEQTNHHRHHHHHLSSIIIIIITIGCLRMHLRGETGLCGLHTQMHNQF